MRTATDAPGQFLPMLIIDPKVGQVILEYSEFLYLNAAASAVAED